MLSLSWSIPSLAWLPVALSVKYAVIDTHVHNANLTTGLPYTFGRRFPDLNQSWTLQDFGEATQDCRSNGDVSTIGVVLMQLEKSPNTFSNARAEALFYQSVADSCAATSCDTPVVGIVAAGAFESGFDATDEYLSDLKKVVPLLRGVRQSLWEQPSSFFLNTSFRAGLRAVAKHGLPFDVLVHARQLADLLTLARAVPEVTFNLNHLGYPPFGNQSAYDDWAKGIRSLAEMPNVYCKLSGMPQAYGKPGWSAVEFAPAIGAALAAFGANRTNWAGNWFVLEEEQWQGSYTSMFDEVLKALKMLQVPDVELEKIYRGTAERLYRLGKSPMPSQGSLSRSPAALKMLV